MTDFLSFFPNKSPLIGMIHIGALPGTPKHQFTIDEIVESAVSEAKIYEAAGFNSIMIENMHDRPYLKGRVGPEIVAAMTVVGREVRRAVHLPVGVQVLAGANREALAVASAAGLEFIRVEGFVFGHVADEGWIEGCAGELLRYRKQIGAESIAILADIKKKHCSHAITKDVTVAETAEAAKFFGADGLIVTGVSTGSAADSEDARAAQTCGLPVVIGSGISPTNVQQFAGVSDGVIVGSSVKVSGYWENQLCSKTVTTMAAAFQSAFA